MTTLTHSMTEMIRTVSTMTRLMVAHRHIVTRVVHVMSAMTHCMTRMIRTMSIISHLMAAPRHVVT